MSKKYLYTHAAGCLTFSPRRTGSYTAFKGNTRLAMVRISPVNYKEEFEKILRIKNFQDIQANPD
jgi:hypothetical protein